MDALQAAEGTQLFGAVSDIVTPFAIYLLTILIGLLGWYARKIDSKIERTDERKVDKEAFLELKNDIRTEFASLHRDLESQNRGSLSIHTSLAILTEKMSRVEGFLEQEMRRIYRENADGISQNNSKH